MKYEFDIWTSHGPIKVFSDPGIPSGHPGFMLVEDRWRARVIPMDQTSTAQDAAPTKVSSPTPTGGRKFDSGKPDLSLNPPVALREMARAFGFGARKYDAFNFESGLSARRLLAAALRHIEAVLDGEEQDTEVYKDAETGAGFSSGAHHLGHAMASCAMYLRCRELGTLTDDRTPNRPPAPVLQVAEAVTTDNDCPFSLVCQRVVDGVMYYRAYNFPDCLRGTFIGFVDANKRGVSSSAWPEGLPWWIGLPGCDRSKDRDEIALNQADGWTYALVEEVVALVRRRAQEVTDADK